MEEQLEELRRTLRSLVVSSPTPVDVRSLARDYRMLVGEPLPLARFGYRDVLTLLKERCSDFFVFQGSVANPILTLIVPDTLKHIDKLVSRQKLSVKDKLKGKRWSIPDRRPQTSLCHGTPMKMPIAHNEAICNDVGGAWSGGWQTPAKTSDSRDQDKREGVKNEWNGERETEAKTSDSRDRDKYDWNGGRETTAKTTDSRDRDKRESNGGRATPVKPSHAHDRDEREKSGWWQTSTNITDARDQDKREWNRGRETPTEISNARNKDKYESLTSVRSAESPMPATNLDTPDRGEDGSVGDAGTDSGRMSMSSRSGGARVDVAVQLAELVADRPHGIWATELPELYRLRYGRELRYGYSMIAFLRGLEGTVFHVRRPQPLGDWLLLDARAPTPPPDPEPLTPAAPPPAPLRPRTDIMEFTSSIRPESLADIERGQTIAVIVGEVYSPSHFWLLLYDNDHCARLYVTMDAMTLYYDKGEGAARSLRTEVEVREGVYCAARYENVWHRAVVARLDVDNTALVRYIDYGTVARVAVADLKPLLLRYGQQPAQAIRARLAGLVPPSRARHWPHSSCAEFLSVVRDRPLAAEIVAVDHEERILELCLIDTSGQQDVCINDLMLQKWFAAERRGSVIGDSYLRPSFIALETGATPNYADIVVYLRHNIRLEHLEEYRRHVLDEPPEMRHLTASDCLDLAELLRRDIRTALESAYAALERTAPRDAAVTLDAAEWWTLVCLGRTDATSAATYLDRLLHTRLPPELA